MFRIAFSLVLVLIFTSNAYSQLAYAPPGSLPNNTPDEFFGGWLSPSNWDGSFELGVNGNQGSSENFNMLAGWNLLRKTDLREVTLDFNYALSSTDGIRTQNFWQLDLKSNRNFEEGSPWSFFSNLNLLSDEFKAYDSQLALNGGLGYKWIDTEDAMVRTRLGAGASREFGGVSDEWIPELDLGLDYKLQLTERQSTGGSLDYFANVTNFSEYRLLADLWWELLLDEETNMSLKFNVIDRYDSTSIGAEPNEIYYSLLLLWRF